MGHLVDRRGEQLEAIGALEKIVGAVNAQVEVFLGWRRYGALAVVVVVAWRPRPAAAQPVLALFAAGSAPAPAAPGRGGSTSGAAAVAIWLLLVSVAAGTRTSTTYGARAAALSTTTYGARAAAPAAALYMVVEVAAPTPTAGAAPAPAAVLSTVTQRQVGGRSTIALRLRTPGPVAGGRRSPARRDRIRTPVLVLAAAPCHLANRCLVRAPGWPCRRGLSTCGKIDTVWTKISPAQQILEPDFLVDLAGDKYS